MDMLSWLQAKEDQLRNKAAAPVAPANHAPVLAPADASPLSSQGNGKRKRRRLRENAVKSERGAPNGITKPSRTRAAGSGSSSKKRSRSAPEQDRIL